MDTVFTPPSATAFEACAGIAAAATYLLVGAAVLAGAPRDIRARLFFATALASLAPYLVPFLIWWRGPAAVLAIPVMIAVALSLMAGSLTLFHFTQVFPWRRPWIRAHGRWLHAGYAAVPLLVTVLVPVFMVIAGFSASDPERIGAVSAGLAEGLVLVLLVIVLPAVFLFGVVLPCAAIYSLFKTSRAAAGSSEAARLTTHWILVSQMAGGVLAVLVIPLLRVVAPTGPWVTIAGLLLMAFSLLMPLAFAAGVWTYRVLELDPETPSAGL